jgi:uncharacterized membrane protein YoaK (UPF0700 family)
MCPVDQHSRVFGQFNSVSNLGFIVGPVVGGYIVDNFGGFQVVASATAICFLFNLSEYLQNLISWSIFAVISA